MSNLRNGLVEIVYDYSKGKLRARLANSSTWVRFPNNLRIAGAIYRVEQLAYSRNCYIAKGDICRVK